MTYICPTCKSTFDEPLRIKEPHGEISESCPDCHDGGIEEAEYCEKCGEYVPLREWMSTDGLCAECLVDFDKEIENADNV